MRAFSACLTVFLGLSAFSIVACSSDATTSGTGGSSAEAGETSSPATGGGGASFGGATGIGEGGACSFDAPTCETCLQDKCGNEIATCGADDTCTGALDALEGCACDASKTIDECKTTFGQNGGDPAAPLVTCYNDNCASACQ